MSDKVRQKRSGKTGRQAVSRRVKCFWCETGLRPLIDPVAAQVNGELFSGAVGDCDTPGCDEALRELVRRWKQHVCGEVLHD